MSPEDRRKQLKISLDSLGAIVSLTEQIDDKFSSGLYALDKVEMISNGIQVGG